jgi:hypothetical protein
MTPTFITYSSLTGEISVETDHVYDADTYLVDIIGVILGNSN